MQFHEQLSFFDTMLNGCTVLLANSHYAQITVHRDFIPGMEQGCCIRHPGDTGNAVFPGNNCPVNEHAPTPLDNTCCQGNDKGHVWVNRIADQHLSLFEETQILGVFYNSDPASADTRSCRLPEKLPCFKMPVFLSRCSLQLQWPAAGQGAAGHRLQFFAGPYCDFYSAEAHSKEVRQIQTGPPG